MNVLQSLSSLSRVRRLAAHVWRHFAEDRLFDEAASLSYTSLLSMVPLLAVVFGVASMFPVFEQWSEQLRSFVFNNFVPASGDQIQTYLAAFLDSVGKLTLTGTLFLILTALLLMVRIERALNLIWRVPAARSVGNRLVMYWAVLTLGPLALGAALALGAQPVVNHVAEGTVSSSSWRALGIFSLSWFAFMLMFWLVPNRRVPLTHAAIGAFLSAVLFALAKKVFVAFVANASFNVIYGALATIPMFLSGCTWSGWSFCSARRWRPPLPPSMTARWNGTGLKNGNSYWPTGWLATCGKHRQMARHWRTRSCWS